MSNDQVHTKFKVFVGADGASQVDAIRRFNAMLADFTRDGKVAAKSVGIEYRERDKRLFLSIGYRDDQAGYPVRLSAISLGVLDGPPETIGAAMEKAAAGVENVICHEFYITDKDEFVMVLLSRG